MNPTLDQREEDVSQTFQIATARFGSLDARNADATRAAVVRVCLARDLLDVAESVLEDADSGHPEILALSADISERLQRWDEAADRYHQLWQTLMGEHLTVPDPGAAAKWFEFSLLGDLRTNYHLVSLSACIDVPALIDRLRARSEKADVDPYDD